MEKKYTVEFEDKELLRKLEAVFSDMASKEYLINSVFETHRYDTDGGVVESKPFQAFLKQFTEIKYEYNMLMDEVQDKYVPEDAQLRGCTWEVKFDEEQVEITLA